MKEETHKLAEKSLTAQGAIKCILTALGGGVSKNDEASKENRQ